jgi:hypothetical protein
MERAIAWPAEYLADDPETLKQFQRIAVLRSKGLDLRTAAKRIVIGHLTALHLWLGGLETISKEYARSVWPYAKSLMMLRSIETNPRLARC